MRDDEFYQGGRVYYLFNDDHRKTLAYHLQMERERLDRESAQVQDDLRVVRGVLSVLDEILTYLARMRLIAVEARREKADRAALSVEFEGLKEAIDRAAAGLREWSPEEYGRIQEMLNDIDVSRLDKPPEIDVCT